MSFKIRSVYTAAILSAVMTVAAVASAKYSASDVKLTVFAHGPIGFDIKGESKKLDVTEDDKNVNFRAYFNAIDTKNSTRNEHMQKRVGKNQTDVILSIAKSDIEKKKASGTVKGVLQLNKVKKDVSIAYTYDAATKKAHGSFAIDIVKDFGVDGEELCNKGICAKPNVEITADLTLNN